MPGSSISTYRAKRDFTVTAEPPPAEARPNAGPLMFVVQKHAAKRAGLHWDLRLEHGGVLWSWAVPRGPSLDPDDRRMAVHVEDHPIDYADFRGAIPDGSYGAGTVETWDRGTWRPLDDDPAAAMAAGRLHFVLHGTRLHGRFNLVRGARRGKQDAWFLMKAADEHAAPGLGAAEIEAVPLASARAPARPKSVRRGPLPDAQAPQLCSLVETAPDAPGWLSEIKFDGYRILARIERGQVRLLTRNGLDWADRMPRLAAAFAALPVKAALLDTELVALDAKGASSFPGLQAALKAGRDDTLVCYAFDLLHLDGTDWRPAPLLDRKRALHALLPAAGMIRYSEHVADQAAGMHENACRMGLEGIVCKRADAPYRAGRSHDWVKVKCLGREEFVVLGWTPPAGSRQGIGALHLGYFDPAGALHYAGGVGTGFTQRTLLDIRKRLDPLAAPPPPGLLTAGDPIDSGVAWVLPELIAEVKYTGWSGAGRIRHGVFLGLREDKQPHQVVREAADPDAERVPFTRGRGKARRGWHGAVPPMPKPVPLPAAPPGAAPTVPGARIVTAKAPKAARIEVGGIAISHPERELWPASSGGITKLDLARYWEAVAEHALPGIAQRPLSILRCPEGIGHETFFQKNGHGHLPPQIREARAAKQPYLAIDGADGLFALAQLSAIELHAWGAAEAEPTKPDQMVFDLDPGEGVPFPAVVQAALDLRAKLRAIGLESLCRTTGGKGLHVVVPLRPAATWDTVKPFCRAFAETLAQEEPDRFVAHVKIADRTGKILIDWLRNGLGATAVASFSPRARPGAGVATPLAWREVTPKLDPGKFTLLTVPKRLASLKQDPWAERAGMDQVLPRLGEPAAPAPGTRAATPRARSTIVVARKPKARS